MALQEKAAAAGLSPWVADYWVCADPLLGVIVMPRLWETLGEAVIGLGDNDALRKKYFADAYAILRSLNHIGIWHGDAHLENFMVDRAGRLYIIDFGQAETIPGFGDWVRTNPEPVKEATRSARKILSAEIKKTKERVWSDARFHTAARKRKTIATAQTRLRLQAQRKLTDVLRGLYAAFKESYYDKDVLWFNKKAAEADLITSDRVFRNAH